MGIPKDYFKKTFARLNIKKSKDDTTISLNLEAFGKKLDIAQDALDAQAWSDMQKYMPISTGNLIQQTNAVNQSTRGEVFLYDPSVEYGHYQYEGILYVDPVYNTGAFFSDVYGYWSRPGVEKIPSERKLEYTNPSAVDHWDEEAYRKHKKQWVKVAKNAMK